MSHFYEKLADGKIEPRHFVPMTSRPNELRPTRITDVRKWRKEGRIVEPSVTTVKDVLAKPQLNNWLIDRHLIQAYVLEPNNYQTVDLWLDAVHYKTDMELEIAPNAGSDLHKNMEKYMKHGLEGVENGELCSKIAEVLFDKTKDLSLAKPEVNFVHELGYGGQCDLVIGYEWIIDYKTKQTAAKFKPGKMAYDDHSMQLAAYRKGLSLSKARCANVFICLEDGQIDFHEHKEEELEKGWEVFKRTLEIWQIQNGWHER